MLSDNKLIFENASEIFTNGYKAIEYAKSIPDSDKPINEGIHFVWCVNQGGREFERKQALSIKSAIATQTSPIYLWSNVDLSHNDWILPILPYIHLRKYDPIELSENTPLEGMQKLLIKDDPLFWLGGDLARLLILYKFGGVYCDCDIVLLRNLSPLCDQEFFYQWGTELDKMNGAVMRLFKESELATNLLEMIPHVGAGENSTSWGSDLYGEVRKFNKNFTVYPCAFFNTEWQLYINMAESGHPFKNGSDSNKDFDGVFAWHWHNKWDAEVEEGSKFYRLEKLINAKLLLEGKNVR